MTRNCFFTIIVSLFLIVEYIPAQGFSTTTAIASVTTTTGTGEKPQSKVWNHGGYWWTVLPTASGTQIWRLDNNSWTSILTVSTNTISQADVKVNGDTTHILLYQGTASELISVEFSAGTPPTYVFWTTRTSTVPISLDTDVETASMEWTYQT